MKIRTNNLFGSLSYFLVHFYPLSLRKFILVFYLLKLIQNAPFVSLKIAALIIFRHSQLFSRHKMKNTQIENLKP